MVGSGIAVGLLIIVLIFNFPNAIPRGATWKARIEGFSSGDSDSNFQAEQAKIGPDPVGDLFQGGTFCAAEFTNDVKRAGP